MNGSQENQLSMFAQDVTVPIGTQSVREIQLTQGKVTLVDEEDYERINKYKWYASRGRYTYYAVRSVSFNGRSRTVKIDRFILNLPLEGYGIIVDHINRNGLDNRKCNIRVVKKGLNQYNSHLMKNNTSGHRGISWYSPRNEWQVRVYKDKRCYFAGRFKRYDQAVYAYNKTAKQVYGKDAII